MDWNGSALAVESSNLLEIRRILQQLPVGQEARMRANLKGIIERMMYTSFEFSMLAGRGVQCSGCAKHRIGCPSLRDPERQRAGQRVMHIAAKKRLVGPAASLGIDLDNDPVCGATSYIGEIGNRDAFEGMVEVLRRRLLGPPAPLEPWSKSLKGTSMQKEVLDTSWFQNACNQLPTTQQTPYTG